MKLPEHACGLFLIHNEHKNYYEELAVYLEKHDYKQIEFASNDARQCALATEEYWELQWYPRTPGSSYAIAAPTLEELLAWAEALMQEDEAPQGQVRR